MCITRRELEVIKKRSVLLLVIKNTVLKIENFLDELTSRLDTVGKISIR